MPVDEEMTLFCFLLIWVTAASLSAAEPLCWPCGNGCATCCADHGLLCCQTLIAVPDDVDDVAAAQFYINPLTAMGIVEVRGACQFCKIQILKRCCPLP